MFDMKLTRTRLVGVAVALGTVAIAAPVSTAGADLGAPADAGVWVGAPGVTVVGPAIITTAPSSFVNTNNQVSTGGNWSGGQFTP
jgi:hypothetical protein